MSDIRQRTKASLPEKTPASEKETSKRLQRQIKSYDEESKGISILDIFRLCFLLLITSFALSYFITGDSLTWGYKPLLLRWSALVRQIRGPIYLTPSELALYNGTDPALPIYISVNHSIYDVSVSPHLYGPGGGYAFFSGRDATRAFVTGCFQEDLTSDLTGVEEMFIPVEDDDDSEAEKQMTSAQKKIRRERELREAKDQVMKQVKHWMGFYEKSDKYFAVGKLILNEEDQNELGSKRPLCEAASKSRPKRSKLRTKNTDDNET